MFAETVAGFVPRLHPPYLLYMLHIYRREGVVDVVLSNTAGIPIYVQIEDQIKAAILRGEVSEGDALPSIRALARDLRVSVITTTRAYAELVTLTQIGRASCRERV